MTNAALQLQQAKERPPNEPAKKSKQVIKTAVTVHDRTQIETICDYFLARGTNKKTRNLSYRVDAFLFYPRQFGVDPHSYPKERFYNDIRPLIRFREPKLSFKQLLGRRPSERSPLLSLSKYLDSLERGIVDNYVNVAIDEARLFACSFINNYLSAIDKKKRKLDRLLAGEVKPRKRRGEGGHIEELPLETPAEASARLVRRIERMLVKIESVLREFRRLSTRAKHLGHDISDKLALELRLIDEYLHYRVRDGIAQLILIVRKGSGLIPDTSYDHFLQMTRELLAAHEVYGGQAGYMHVDDMTPDDLKERYLHRRGELKRRIWEVLFLSIRTTPLFKFQQQMGAMIAAGLAAAWAVVTQIIIIRKYIASADPTDLVGTTGLIFLVAGVFAYVIKDRIKEVGRSYFRGRLFRRIPDQSERIYYQDRPVGSLTERARFVAIGALPEPVAELRSRATLQSGEGEETVSDVLWYTKIITLDNKIRILGRYPLKVVHDILRLNIDAYLPRLGEPRRMMNLIDTEANIYAVGFPKVYYLDLVLDYSRLDRGHNRAQRSTEYFRLVIDKSGLQRVERLM